MSLLNGVLSHPFFITCCSCFLFSGCSFKLDVFDLNEKSALSSQPSDGSDPSNNPPASPGEPQVPTVSPNAAITIVTYPTNVTGANANNYNISGLCSDVVGIDIKLNSVIVGTSTCSGGAWSAIIDASSISDGNLVLEVSPTGATAILDIKNVIKDATPPVIVGFVEDGEQLVSINYSPWIIWSAASDVSSGLARYEVRIVDDSGNSITVWTDAGVSLNYHFMGLSLNQGQTYFAQMRAIDNFGNISAPIQSDGWFVVPQGWRSQAYLKAPNAEAGDMFGNAVAISGDTIAVGADWEQSNQTTITNGATASANNSSSSAGAVYVFKRSGSFWAQEAYLKAPNAQTSDFFGNALAIDGDTIVVGAYFEDSNQTTITNGATASANNTSGEAGAVYVFKRSGSSWVQEAYLKASNAQTNDRFGKAVAISRDTIVVGAYFEDSNQTTITNGATASADNTATDSGAVYVYKRTDINWAQEAYLKAANSELDDFYGISVAIHNDTIVVGADSEDSNQTTITNGATASADNTAPGAGAVYVYKRSGNTWAQQAYIKAANAESGDAFGSCVAISGDTIAVGARSERSNQTTITNGVTASADNSAPGAGAVYVYKRTDVNWTQEAYIKPPNAESFDQFGNSIAIDSDMIAVGVSGEDSNQTTITNGATASADNTSAGAGAVYIYKRTGVNWAQEAYIKAPNAEAGDGFGVSVKISESTLVVGANGEDSSQTTVTNGTIASSDNSAASAGAAYVFVVNRPAAWVQQAYVKAANAEASDQFGYSVAIDGDTVVVGANYEDSNQTIITNGATASNDNTLTSSGAVYVYKRVGSSWSQEAFIKAANAKSGVYFGENVAVSGDTIVVGAPFESSNQTTITNGTSASADSSALDAGAIYVYKRTGTNWAQQAYIKAPNAEGSDSFGISVAIAGDTIVVGATGEDSAQTTITNGATASANNSALSSGAAYIFHRIGNNWSQQAYLKAANADSSDFFGVNVDISGDTVVVGVANEDSAQTTITNGSSASGDNSALASGAAYVFKRSGVTWSQEAYLKASNADSNDRFGWDVGISGDTIVVGAFDEDSNQITITNGATASANNALSGSGAAYIFKRDGVNWSQQAYLKAPNLNTNDFFGRSVAISSDVVVVGVANEDSAQTTITNGNITSTDNSLSNSGAVYVFKRTGNVWSQEAYLKAPNADSGDSFGGDVEISGNTIVVGAVGEDSNQTTITNGSTASSNNSSIAAGAVYIFNK